MRPDVHAAALRSAAKLVFGMASLASFTVACAATSEEPASNSEAVTADSKKGDSDAGAATGDDDDSYGGSSCDAKAERGVPSAPHSGTSRSP